MALLAADARSRGVWAGMLSVELEKPALPVSEVRALLGACDVVFFSKDFVLAHAPALLPTGSTASGATDGEAAPGTVTDPEAHTAVRCLRALLPLSAPAPPTAALWIVPWGATGAFALHAATGTSVFEPAVAVTAVDSVGAGDTFIGASLHALALLGRTAGATGAAGVPPPTAAREALRFACAVAARKVSQFGFEGLGGAVPLPAAA